MNAPAKRIFLLFSILASGSLATLAQSAPPRKDANGSTDEDARRGEEQRKSYYVDSSKDQELIEGWKKQNSTMRELELRHLCLRTKGRLTPFVISVIEDQQMDPAVRMQAADDLKFCDQPKLVVDALKRAAGGGSELLEGHAADSLFQLKEYSAAADTYIRHLSEGSWYSAWSAAGRLENFKRKEAELKKMAQSFQRIKADTTAPTWRRALAALGLASSNVDQFDDLTAKLVADYLADVVRAEDPESDKNAERVINWLEGIERNLKPSREVRNKIVLALNPATQAKSESIRTHAERVTHKTQIK